MRVVLKAASASGLAAIARIAARLEPRVRDEFLRAIAAIKDGVDLTALADALDAGRMGDALDALGLDRLPAELQAAAETVRQVFHGAGTYAAEELSAALSEVLAFDVVNPRAVRYAAELGSTLIRDLSEATRAGVRTLIADGIAGGRAPMETAREIRNLVGLTERQAQAVLNYRDKLIAEGQAGDLLERRVLRYGQQLLTRRAQIIARTETIRASAQGQLESWRQAAANGYLDPNATKRQWSATEDDRICPICEGLDGDTVPFADPFRSDVGPIMAPPAHPACVLGETRVDVQSALALIERPYDGDVVVLSTASGNRLSCTPNHPILTSNGWVAAARIAKGDDVISSSRREWMARGDEDHDHRPPRIDQVSDTLRCSSDGLAVSMEVSAEDFHGDGIGSKVAVIRTDRLLLDGDYSPNDQQGGEIALGFRDMKSVALGGNGSAFSFTNGSDSTTGGSVAFGETNTLLGGVQSAPDNPVRVASRSSLDAHLDQTIPNDAPLNPESSGERFLGFSSEVALADLVNGDDDALVGILPAPTQSYTGLDQADANESSAIAVEIQLARDLLAGLAGPVFRDQVIDVERFPFIGHVFNLETRGGYFVANGIVTHNCRCSVVLVFER